MSDSEAVELRLAELKTFVGLGMVLMAVGIGYLLVGLEMVGLATVFMASAGAMLIFVRARQTDGVARRVAEKTVGEYHDPPTNEWRDNLKERGEL